MMHLIEVVGGTGWCAYAVVTWIIWTMRIGGLNAPPVFRAIRSELKPFALPLLVIGYLPLRGPWDIFWLAWNLMCWWVIRNDKDDDDRWKRRRQRLAAKVAEVGGKLAVVPS